ncbi:hypothetical protein PO81_21435 [Vibrio parahaemolyticus]|nr:hypothetical protein PO81_21435 [Vibrio parahaemolyticus]
MCFWLGSRISISSCLSLRKSSFGSLYGLSFLFQTLISLLKVCSAALSFQKVCLVFKVRFLRRCMFQVVSATGALKLRLI